MAGQTDNGGDDLISTINVTPLVDIFLVLLIVFMLTAKLFMQEQERQKQIPLTLPAAYSGNKPDKEASPLNVIIDQAGKLYLNGAPSDMDAIGKAIEAARAKDGPPSVVLSADQDLAYKRVTRVIDYMQLLGIGDLAINVEEQTIRPDGSVAPAGAPDGAPAGI
jgi:biopolymer transport protein ExbD